MAIKLISVSEDYWGDDFPESMPALAQVLLGTGGQKEYNFTGKQRALCRAGMTVVFRYDGYLLGEGEVVDVRDDGWQMIYRPTRVYRPPVRGSNFFKAGASIYYEFTSAQLAKIRAGVEAESSDPYPKTGEKPGMTTHRIGQDAVRKSALSRYKNRCCLCGVDDPRLLVAGHIRGWARGEKQRGQPENVVLMCLLHDGMFGKGLMSLKPTTYQPEFAEKALPVRTLKLARKITRAFRGPTRSPPSDELLRWHRKHVFLGDE
ncbi:MAG: HNH endonuclease signature motif containing protein [Verrucomicrobia bacterium]|nr:HNH endonuclease signature motif containing protein [Verrucomicrobiota bacterium]